MVFFFSFMYGIWVFKGIFISFEDFTRVQCIFIIFSPNSSHHISRPTSRPLFFFSVTHCIQCVLPVRTWCGTIQQGIGSLPWATPLKKTSLPQHPSTALGYLARGGASQAPLCWTTSLQLCVVFLTRRAHLVKIHEANTNHLNTLHAIIF